MRAAGLLLDCGAGWVLFDGYTIGYCGDGVVGIDGLGDFFKADGYALETIGDIFAFAGDEGVGGGVGHGGIL